MTLVSTRNFTCDRSRTDDAVDADELTDGRNNYGYFYLIPVVKESGTRALRVRYLKKRNKFYASQKID